MEQVKVLLMVVESVEVARCLVGNSATGLVEDVVVGDLLEEMGDCLDTCAVYHGAAAWMAELMENGRNEAWSLAAMNDGFDLTGTAIDNLHNYPG